MTQLLHNIIVPRLGPHHRTLLWKPFNLRLGSSSTPTLTLIITLTTFPQYQPLQFEVIHSTQAPFGPLQVQISYHHRSPLQRLPWSEYPQGPHLDLTRGTPQGFGVRVVTSKPHPRCVGLQVSPLRGPTRAQTPLKRNRGSNNPYSNTKAMRNIPIESPFCNLAFWLASQSTHPIVIAQLHISSELHSCLITSPHLALITSPSSSCH